MAVVEEGAKKKKFLTKNEKKRAKKKAAKLESREATSEAPPPPPDEDDPPLPDDEEVNVVVEYVSAAVDVEPGMEEFKAIFEKFGSVEELTKEDKAKKPSEAKEKEPAAKGAKGEAAAKGEGEGGGGGGGEGGDSDEEGEESGEKRLSRKARKKASRLSVAELKQLVQRADVVEAHDVTSADPRFLVFLKAYRNTVPVPRHWCHKRKYLQGKRGIEKTPFQLPEFIATTGIEKIRTALMEQEALQSAKQKGRGRVAPKMGKIDIDYQVLHDAFFKYQKKPSLSGHGDLYYEGKEFEVKLRSKAPGNLSASLKEALAIPEGAPPPWLINMQRYGPPPAYPNLRVPGLNAPLPQGCKFGFQPGEWGKPPVDEYGRPLYGDVFSSEAAAGADTDQIGREAVDRTPWGQLGSESEPESEEEESGSEEEGEPEGGDLSGLETPGGDGTASVMSGVTSVTTGLETPGLDSGSEVDLRKRAGLETPDTSGLDSGLPKTLYQVVPEQAAAVGTAGFFGAEKAYSLGGQAGATGAGGADGASSIQKVGVGQDDEEDSERKRKRKEAKEKDAKKKKYGDFKF